MGIYAGINFENVFPKQQEVRQGTRFKAQDTRKTRRKSQNSGRRNSSTQSQEKSKRLKTQTFKFRIANIINTSGI